MSHVDPVELLGVMCLVLAIWFGGFWLASTLKL